MKLDHATVAGKADAGSRDDRAIRLTIRGNVAAAVRGAVSAALTSPNPGLAVDLVFSADPVSAPVSAPCTNGAA